MGILSGSKKGKRGCCCGCAPEDMAKAEAAKSGPGADKKSARLSARGWKNAARCGMLGGKEAGELGHDKKRRAPRP